MTVLHQEGKILKINKEKRKSLISIFVITISILFSVILPSHINKFVKEGLSLCFNVVIASVFPFLIITDLFVAFSNFENVGFLQKVFEKLFKINKYAVSAFLCGLLCGFPLGVKVSADLYRNGCISKNECERLIGFSNNTGPAFLISGIGFAMRGSVIDGIILYFSMIISSILSGLILGIGKKPSSASKKQIEFKYNFSESVSNASLNTLNISAYIVLFSIITGVLSLIIKNNVIFSLILPFLEVSNAAKTLSLTNIFTKSETLILTSFAVSFSGVSVHMQAKSFLSKTDISMKTYYFAKLLQGLLASLITTLIVFIK